MTSHVTWKRPVSAGNKRLKAWASVDGSALRSQSLRSMDDTYRGHTSCSYDARPQTPSWRDEPQLRRGRPHHARIQNPDVGNAILVDTCLDLMRDSLMSTLAKCRHGRKVVRTDPSEQYIFEKRVSRHLWRLLSETYDANAEFLADYEDPRPRQTTSIDRILAESNDRKYRPPWRP